MRRIRKIANQWRLRHLEKKLQAVKDWAPKMKEMSDLDLQEQTARFRKRLKAGESLEELLPEAYATVREVAFRVLEQFPFDVQVIGAIALHEGCIAEMKTGEGKTLTATMPLYLNALTGQGAFLVTTNDYLARRDAQEMGPIYQWLGLTVAVGCFGEEEEVDLSHKQAVYQADITYITAATLGFDYLTNNLVGSKAEQFLRPYHFAIVDEADAVLLDNAQTPLIISGSPRVQSNLYDSAKQFVMTLKKDEEYKLDTDKRVIYLTEAGSRYAERYFQVEHFYDGAYFELNRMIYLALQARHLYKKDRDYVVMGQEVKLLDQRTGRILEGTRLQSGLHQALETKEGLPKTKESRAMGTITYQALFNMFPCLAGMTGTAKVAEDELIATYGLPVTVIPTHRPIRRVDYPDQIYLTLPEKLYATLDLVKKLHARGQPILLVAGSVEIAEIYSDLLLQEGLAHNTLTAKNIPKEALIIQEAGQLGAITVATPLAGRGTDIKLGPGAAAVGGLAVIGAERMPNSRIDWQLRGRAGRQGDPGMSQFFASLEDELLTQYGSKSLQAYFEKAQTKKSQTGRPLAGYRFRRALSLAQERSEDKAESARQSTIQFDESMKIQRRYIYALRDELMASDTQVSDKIHRIFKEVIDLYVAQHPHRSESDFRRYLLEQYSYQFQAFPAGFTLERDEDLKGFLTQLYQKELDRKREQLASPEDFSTFLRLAILKAIDECWIEQVDGLQQLKSVVSTRHIAQRNSMYEYYQEAWMSYEQVGILAKELIVKHVMLSSIDKDDQGHLSIYFV